MALGLVLSYAPVSSDVTLSTQGTYFQNDAPGRKWKSFSLYESKYKKVGVLQIYGI